MKLVFSSLLFICIQNFLFSTDTKVVVRAKAKDAKFIGSSLGGAFVIIKDKRTGEVLASGETQGSTGNTRLIMNIPRRRGMPIADEGTAKFIATIDLDEPTFVTIEVSSPKNHRKAIVSASTELWLIPGKHILGDGIIIDIPGFIVDIIEPRTHQYIQITELSNNQLKIKANVVMMCGCLIDKNGEWDPEKIEVNAIINLNDTLLQEVPLRFVSMNMFEAKLGIDQKGRYEITVYAFNQYSGNTGVDIVNYVVY